MTGSDAEAEAAETEIIVRSLDGAAATVSISRDRTIGDLKSLLKDSFPPATSSPNFHLFFKGVKLGDADRIRSCGIEHSEFVVLVPFVKKVRRRPETKENDDVPEPSAALSNCSQSTKGTSPADLAWLDIMQDLSSTSDVMPGDVPSSSNCGATSSAKGENSLDRSSNTKRHKKESFIHSDLLDIFRGLEGKDGLDTQTHLKIRRVLDAVNCLSDWLVNNSHCLLFREVCRNSKETERCMCPPWMKRIIKCFAFVNIFFGIQQMHRKCLTCSCLKEALSIPDAFGIGDIGISDVENLFILSPKVVVLVKEGSDIPKLGDAVIIFDGPTETEQFILSLNRKEVKDSYLVRQL